MLGKIYDSQKTENKIYRLWEKLGYFNPDKLPGRRKVPFVIIMPPPNANDPLHIGHAVGATLEDIIIRYQRMKGKKALWLPGTDHGGFETQVVFEKKLSREGKSSEQMTAKEFYKGLWQYTQKNKKIAKSQLKQLGASCDWSREKFTLDKKIVEVVYETLENLFEDGLLYRGKRLVNYCPKNKTAFSDLEVKYEEEKSKLYYLAYSIKNGGGKAIIAATTRPETIPGDVALAVNPKDKRYKDFVGKTAIEPITSREIPIIADSLVEIDFGTGALKITPAHDPVDFEIGKKHNLETRETLNYDGRFNNLAGPLEGLKTAEARQKAIEILKGKGALTKEEDYSHQVGHCYKCGTIIEPMLMDQWFVAMKKLSPPFKKSLQELAIEAVKKGKIKIIPKHYEKIFFHWLENIKDWNISRQIKWGIPIPAYYCLDCGEIFLKIKGKASLCPKCKSRKIEKDKDVLDTWFSSGQWPFATLLSSRGSKSKIKYQKSKSKYQRSKLRFVTKDFLSFYPTDVMETGWDILFFWVARMIILGIYRTGEIPFKVVYLHGLVRDKDRQKMSKSKGNVIDPLLVSKIYGTDALRMALVIGNTAGSDSVISEEKIRGYRNFANKIWNASRFVLMNLEGFEGKKPKLNPGDKKIIKYLGKTEKKVASCLDKFRFSLAGETLYHYFWHTFADKIIEEMKIRIRENRQKKAAQYLLYKILTNCLIMLHPFMPFITEAIWQKTPHYKDRAKVLMVENWPSK